MPASTPLMQRLRLRHPIIQAPMAGGGDTPALVAAVGDAGGMGFVGAAYLTPEQLKSAVQSVRERTASPFGINLFAPLPLPPLPDTAAAIAQLAPYHGELGLPAPEEPAPPADHFDALVRAALESGAAAFSWTFGIMPPEIISAAKGRGMLVLGTATTVAEARELEMAGVDAIVVQGMEAGGHRGSFTAEGFSTMVGTVALVPQVVDAVAVPVVASGGIMDGRGIAAALALGASAVQMGTAFLTCAEAGVAPAYKQAIIEASDGSTCLTRAFSGRPARGIANRVVRGFQQLGSDEAILPFPWQNALTRPMRLAAARQDRADFLSLWAGQGAPLARRLPAGELVARLAEETAAALARLNQLAIGPLAGPPRS